MIRLQQIKRVWNKLIDLSDKIEKDFHIIKNLIVIIGFMGIYTHSCTNSTKIADNKTRINNLELKK